MQAGVPPTVPTPGQATGVAICIFAAMVIFAATIIYCVQALRKRRPWNGALLVGIFLIECVLLFGARFSDIGSFDALLHAFLFSLDSLGGTELNKAVYPGPEAGGLGNAYRTLLHICMFLAPICTVGFVASFFEKFMRGLRRLTISKQNLHVFSVLTPRSYSLGVSVCQSEPNARLVFCQASSESPLAQAATRQRALLLPGSIDEFSCRYQRITFYLIKDHQDQNINECLALIKRYRTSAKPVTINVFFSKRAYEPLFDSADRGNIRLRIVDEAKYTCYALLSQYPLYIAKTQEQMSVLVVGAGRTGLEFIKAMVWAGQLPQCNLTIHVADQNAERIRHKLSQEAPGMLSGGYDIRFHAVDVHSDVFIELLKGELRQVRYIVIATGSDDGNIAAAERIHRQLLRQNTAYSHDAYRILVRIRDQEAADAFKRCVESTGAECMLPFGSADSAFSYAHLSNNRQERAALLVNRAYFGVLHATEEQAAAADRSFYSREYNQRSSLAVALHIQYKLYSLGILPSQASVEELADITESALADPQKLEEISICEHDRWMAFLFSEGYECADEACFMQYAPVIGAPVYHAAKLHPCLVPWKDLDRVSRMVNKAFPDRSPDYCQYDRDIVLAIPEILRRLQ